MDDGRLDALGQTIVGALPGAATDHTIAFGQLTVAVQADKIVDVATFLRDDPGCRFVNFTDITAVDYPGREKRFDVVYHFLSPTLNARIRLRLAADETTQVPSIPVPLVASAVAAVSVAASCLQAPSEATRVSAVAVINTCFMA